MPAAPITMKIAYAPSRLIVIPYEGKPRTADPYRLALVRDDKALLMG
jgi:hypothetical protein